MNAPIRVRMTAWYVMLLAAIIAAVGAFVVIRLRADLTSATDRSLRSTVPQIAAGYSLEGLLEFRDKSSSLLAGERNAAQILSAAGTVVSSAADRVSRLPMLDQKSLPLALRSRLPIRSRSFGGGPQFRVAAASVVRRGERQVIVAAVSLAPVDHSVHRVLILLLLALPAALVATAAGGWWLAKRAMRPIDRMVRAAEGIGATDLSTRLTVPASHDELAHLATTLNVMLDRIYHGVTQQQRLVADTSHELRTPLAVMRTDIDVSLGSDDLSPAATEVLMSNREEVDRMIATVDDLMILARTDERGLRLTPVLLDLQELASRAVRRLGPHAHRHNVELATDGPSATVRADPARLDQVLRNLIDNAIKFGGGGPVTVRTWQTSQEAGVTVEDDGPGIPQDLGERVFDRFFRVDRSRDRASGGSGLGLAIVRELVVAHGGRVAVAPRLPHGSAFTIALPTA
ncbi:MAG: HAMP domain-containing histidine kinase [Actinomycetota bacterium]|nr:HAMP domain-containing histidine kinase [Actinomycetota bacterium]